MDSLLEQYSDAQTACHNGIKGECDRATILLHQLALANAQAKLQDCLNTKAPLSNLAIVGIETTQGIQFFLFNGQGSGAASNNSVPLIASKDLTLRVYVNQTALPGIPIPAYITGVVTVAGSTQIPAFVPIPARPQAPSTVETSTTL